MLRNPETGMAVELWDLESGNLVGAFSSEAEAIEQIRETINAYDTLAVAHWALADMTDPTDESAAIEGSELIERALAHPAA